MSKFIAHNINWDVDMDEIYELLDNSTAAKAAELLEISSERYAAMTTEERHDYAYDKIRHNRLDAAEMVGLPEEVEIPEDILEYYEITSVNDDMSDITDWLSDEYGYCIDGYDVREEDEKVAGITDVKVGDVVTCYDEYSRDSEEHFIIVESIEKDKENACEDNPEGVVLYGRDLEHDENDDNYVSVVHSGNFIGICDDETKKLYAEKEDISDNCKKKGEIER